MTFRQVRLRATSRVQVTQVAIPAKRDNIDNQYTVLHWHVLEVCELDPGPDHEVLGQTRDVGIVETFLDRGAFEVGHGGEEETCEWD
jgi:hypothetical protein